MPIWHLGFASKKRGSLFPTEKKRREAVHSIARVGGERVALFGFVYEHGHTLSVEQKRAVAWLRRSLRISLGAVAELCLEKVWHDLVEGKKHARYLVKYILVQPEHHKLSAHPALWSGSSFQDLVGARYVEGLHPRLEEVAPGLSLAEVQGWVGLPPGPVAPARDGEIRSLGAVRLKKAAAGALAADPRLEGKSKPVTSARRTAARLALDAGIAGAEVSFALGVSSQSIRRLARRVVKPQWLRATRIRLALEQMVLKEVDFRLMTTTD